jgi:chemotaxis-related protein WspD
MQATEFTIDDCWNRIGVWRSGAEKCPELDNVDHCRNCQVFSKTARKLLRTRPPEDYRNEWTQIIATEKKREEGNAKSAFIFRAGNEWLALPAHMIQEVVNMGPIHSIPNMNRKTLRGLVNIHGRLQICVSIGRVLGIEKRLQNDAEPDPDYSAGERLVVVLQENHLVAFPVSEVKGVVRYNSEMLKDLPVTISGSKALYTAGILHLEGKDIGLLKDKPLFNALTKDIE